MPPCSPPNSPWAPPGVPPSTPRNTPLVTTGPFRLVRNPIYAALTVVIASLALAVPNAIAVLGLAVMALGIEIQVRRIEEPYLQSIHGNDYQRYAARTGRFLPGLGRER
ncbi:methyltransferase family protein [Streptomyces sp. BA2]|uniref:methyltransferase family protein n=1 Tax=Streptomyces sp. BA2 TaxID=436595 RepID=UPI001923F69D|nr:isoprenylcysteine carboxylmethyltransferase family protein [Streptomyces sp. BA2]